MQEKRELIKRIDQLVRMKVPGNATVLAEKLKISRSTFFRVIEDMKDNLGAPIFYNQLSQRYEYKFEGKIQLGFLRAVELDKDELDNVKE